MLKIITILIQVFFVTPIRSLFDRKHIVASLAIKPRKKRRVNAETIELYPCETRESVEDGRTIYASCNAHVDGISYTFDLVHQSGLLDTDGRQKRPCWSWIKVQGPHRTQKATMIEASFAVYPPYLALSCDLLRTGAVRQAIAQWRKIPAIQEAAALADKQENRFRWQLVREGQRRRDSLVPRSQPIKR